MIKLAEAGERIAATTKKLEKIAIVAEYLQTRTLEDASVSAVFLSGRPFPAWEEATLQVGGRALWRILAELSGKTEADLTAAYRKLGDLGAVAEAVLPASTTTGHVGTGALARPGRAKPGSSTLSLPDVAARFREIAAARGPAAKAALVRELLSQASPLEGKYIVKIMTGDLRIGLKESLVEEAIAKAYGGTVGEVQRANMLLGDIGETLKLAADGRLAGATMRLFHPLGFMLASPAASAEEALGYFENALVEDKYDGIRAQAHCSGGEVRIFSRTRDEITESFPELPDALAGLPEDAILDGEIVAWSYENVAPASRRLSGGRPARRGESGTENASSETGRALPFSALQQRLGRKQVSETLMRQVPVAYLVFDVLYAGGELLLERPLLEREKILDALLAAPRKSPGARIAPGKQAKFEFGDDLSDSRALVIRAPVYRANAPQELDQLFDAAQARGNEGLMIKDPASAYTPGRRGKSWLKLKRELATLDVVVTAVEYGHGKRIGVLSDYTFAVHDGDRLVNIGKAYSGLTDSEIAEMTRWFLEHTLDDQGFRLVVEPRIVVEVAFNNMMQSDRHESGYALRFPRIVRLRPDKLPEEADTIDRVREIYEGQ
ncbi:MAG TPA: ATP-dependent DNA ligase [Terriglobales bacterium]|nr:ATP-dependent DNA ligase [Terriglobales bacterium]